MMERKTHAARLLERRHKASTGLPPMAQTLRGSVVVVTRYCGKVNCHCRKGFKHRSLYVSRRENGKSRLIYIPRKAEEKIRKLISNYKKVKAAIEEISRINIQLAAACPSKDKR